MPSETEVLRALDNLRTLILDPPSSVKVRQQKLMQVYRTLRRLQPDHRLYREPEPEAPKPETEGDDLDRGCPADTERR
jgi:hypothetical protein